MSHPAFIFLPKLPECFIEAQIMLLVHLGGETVQMHRPVADLPQSESAVIEMLDEVCEYEH